MSGEVPKPKQSSDLVEAVKQAYEGLQEAHAGYEEALAVIADAGYFPDGGLALRQRGRDYAQAVLRYSDAVMAWLTRVESNRDEALKLLSKTKASGK